jgi:hypothetical protein
MKEQIAWFIFTNFNLTKFPSKVSEWVYKNIGW